MGLIDRPVKPVYPRTEDPTRGDDAPAVQVPPPEQSYKPDDDVIALELAEKLKDQIAFFHGIWRVYEHGVWRARNVSELRRYIRKELRSWRLRGISVSQNKIVSLSRMLEDDMFISDEEIMSKQGEQRRYVNMRNGLFNLETHEFERRHDPTLYFTNQMDFDFDEDADCPTFIRFVNTSLVMPTTADTDFSLVKLVVEMLGYCMTARTDLKVSFWLVGQKDSGKSTFVSMLKSLLGSLHGTIDLNQLGMNRFILSGVVGKRVVSFTEADGSTVLPDALYKALVGGSDELQADVKNRDPITFRPECKVVWSMNDTPRMTDRSGATTRRIIFIPYNRTIPENERIGKLEHLLTAERAGIFNLAMSGYARLCRSGHFTLCEQSEEMRRQYIEDNDTEAAFLVDCAELHPSHSLRASELYLRYSGWCVDCGFKPKNIKQVAKEWRRLGFIQKTSNGSWWHGLKLST